MNSGDVLMALLLAVTFVTEVWAISLAFRHPRAPLQLKAWNSLPAVRKRIALVVWALSVLMVIANIVSVGSQHTQTQQILHAIAVVEMVIGLGFFNLAMMLEPKPANEPDESDQEKRSR